MVARKAPLVERVFTMLTPDERSALVLRHTRQLGVAQIALALGCQRTAAVRLLQEAESKVRAAQQALIQALLEVTAARPAPRRAPAARACIVEPRPEPAPPAPAKRSPPTAQKRAKVGPVDDAVVVQVSRP